MLDDRQDAVVEPPVVREIALAAHTTARMPSPPGWSGQEAWEAQRADHQERPERRKLGHESEFSSAELRPARPAVSFR